MTEAHIYSLKPVLEHGLTNLTLGAILDMSRLFFFNLYFLYLKNDNKYF